jgi:hypothetical protein
MAQLVVMLLDFSMVDLRFYCFALDYAIILNDLLIKKLTHINNLKAQSTQLQSANQAGDQPSTSPVQPSDDKTTESSAIRNENKPDGPITNQVNKTLLQLYRESNLTIDELTKCARDLKFDPLDASKLASHDALVIFDLALRGVKGTNADFELVVVVLDCNIFPPNHCFLALMDVHEYRCYEGPSLKELRCYSKIQRR